MEVRDEGDLRIEGTLSHMLTEQITIRERISSHIGIVGKRQRSRRIGASKSTGRA